MQQIERYGVIALVFLLVTIVAISFWGDSKSPGFWSRLTGKNQPKNEVAKVDPQPLPSQIANPDLALSPAAPLGTPQPIDSLGAPQPLTSIDAPATGSSTLQPPENQIVIGAPPAGGPGAMVPMNTPNTPVATPGTVVAPPPAAPVSSAEYMVQRGDSLARIARNQLGAESRWQEIADLNPSVNPKNLPVGQKLVMPTGAAAFVPNATASRAEPRSTPQPKKSTAKTAPASAEKPKSEKSSGARVCTVQKGDTLRSIARRELGDERRWKEIAGLNPSIDPSKLAIGQRVKLPTKSGELIAAVPASSSSSSSSKPRVR